ncbi:MAG: alpha/beta hydrolase [Crenarchaeota archaeon]|nr:MAG: alpha/beta hydrolase [Thermoproteota archaeon]RDJ32835.1 MAG: alpha/beta hydrolase [Thermoproteota archaeon]RDJ38003.1 MAG: alpha/beta hydrolase [Thermoproteota archaeon]RDJ38333.1 MAG: alpha/beta hydrolase [Thermoproteota archaeon]
MEEKFVSVDGNKIRYLESGEGKEVLVLIHGLGASAERWEYVIPIFEKHYRVIVPDLIGFGLSDKPLVDYTQEFFVDFLSHFLKEISVSSPYLIGSSLGGQICAEYVSKYDNVKKLVLVSPSGAMSQSTPALEAYVMAALYPTEEGAKNAFEHMAGDEQVDPKIIHGFIERMQLPNAKMAFMSTLLGLKNANDITEHLKKIESPTLIIWGDKDPVIPFEYSSSFVSAIKDCRFFNMEQSGHTPYVDNPELFAETVVSFLDE